jgi:hypothetical protein
VAFPGNTRQSILLENSYCLWEQTDSWPLGKDSLGIALL